VIQSTKKDSGRREAISPCIERGRLEHAAQAVEIATESLRAFGLTPDPSFWDREIFRMGQNPPAIHEFVVVHDERILGFGIIELVDFDHATIKHLHVDSTMRRLGHGRSLLRAMTGFAHSCGIIRLELQTRTCFVAAVSLYEAEGWTLVDCTPTLSGPELTYALSLPH